MAENENKKNGPSEQEIKRAKEVFETLRKALDARNWTYTTDPVNLKVSFNVRGDNLLMDFIIFIDPLRQLIRFKSKLPLQISEERRLDVAIATCQINYRLADGCYHFDLQTGEISFILTSSFRESIISQDVLSYMVQLSCQEVQADYNQLMMIEKGTLSIDDFLKKM